MMRRKYNDKKKRIVHKRGTHREESSKVKTTTGTKIKNLLILLVSVIVSLAICWFRTPIMFALQPVLCEPILV